MGKSKKNMIKVPTITLQSFRSQKQKGNRAAVDTPEDGAIKRAKLVAKKIPPPKVKKHGHKVIVALPLKPSKKAQPRSEEDESDEDEPTKRIAKASVSKVGKAGPAVKVAPKVKSESDSDEESEDESSEEERSPTKAIAKVPVSRWGKPGPVAKGKTGLAAVGKSGPHAKVPAKFETEIEDDDNEDKSSKELGATRRARAQEESNSDDQEDSEDDMEDIGKLPPRRVGLLQSDEDSEHSDDEGESDDEEESIDEDESDDEEPLPKKPKVEVSKEAKRDMQNGDTRGAKSKSYMLKPGKQGGDTGGSKTIFIKNLPWAVTEENILDFFGNDVVDVRLARDDSGRIKGFGHIEFKNEGAAKKALKKGGQSLLGRNIYCDLAQKRGSQSAGSMDWKSPQSGGNNSYSGTPQSARSAVDKTVFVKGFNKYQEENTIREQLCELFGECGKIDNIRIPTDRETAQIKGFAYVEFSASNASAKALELSGQELNGLTLVVDMASQPSGDSGGGRGRGACGGRGFRGRGRASGGHRFGGRGQASFRGGNRGRGGNGGSGGKMRQSFNLGASGRGRGGRGGSGGKMRQSFNLGASGRGKKTTFSDD